LNIKEIVDVFVRGETVNNEINIKIVEGWRSDEIIKYLSEKNVVDKDIFAGLIARADRWNSESGGYAFLDGLPSGADLEGFLFPDTYRIYTNASEEDIVIKMLNNFSKKFSSQIREDIKKQNKSVYDIIKMASLVEREVRTLDDMKTVAGIFYNRLKINQALQSDATLSYYLKDKKPAHNFEELQIDTPYNSYKYPGLPPTPISNPGLNAIIAAVYPAQTSYYYFLSRPSGETVFSKTYQEHLRNKERYLK